MKFFETFPFLADPLFILFLIGCGFSVRAGALLMDWTIENLKWLLHRWQNRR